MNKRKIDKLFKLSAEKVSNLQDDGEYKFSFYLVYLKKGQTGMAYKIENKEELIKLVEKELA